MTWAAEGETKVEIKQTHACCGACVKAVAAVLDKAGVKGAASQDTDSIVFTELSSRGPRSSPSKATSTLKRL